MTLRRARSIEALILALCGWTAGRSLYLIADNEEPRQQLAPRPNIAAYNTANTAHSPVAIAPLTDQPIVLAKRPLERLGAVRTRATTNVAPVSVFSIQGPIPATTTAATQLQQNVPPPAKSSVEGPQTPAQLTAWTPRLTGSAWVLFRPDARGVALGTTGQLGGSQAGFRVVAPLDTRSIVRASVRGSLALQSQHQPELAPGVSLAPISGVPIELIAERRLRLYSGANDATAIFLAGGDSFRVGEQWQASIYAQGGVVGMKDPQTFADGAATFRRSVGRSGAIGVGVWSGIQPKLERLDIGPSAAMSVQTPAGMFHLSIDGRFRVAGNAAPGSGIALTLAKDF